MVPEKGVSERYLPEIDGLRAIAFFGVLGSHYVYEPSMAGPLGVWLFFVISGFLITDILIASREKAKTTADLFHRLFHFYVRRAIRLWPVLYIVLLITLLIFPEARSSAKWHIFQLSNLFYSGTKDWHPWPLAHLWTLNVEEQFYLLWPLLILFLPRGILGPCILFSAMVGLVWSLVFSAYDGLLLHDRCFPLVIGGALALYGRDESLCKTLAWLGPLGLAADVFFLIPPLFDLIPKNLTRSTELVATVSFAYLVNGARFGSLGIIGKVLQWRPLVAVGKITYGAYVVHLPVLLILSRLPLMPTGYGLARFLIATPVVLIVASLSWVLLETPLNRLKRFFPVS
jgi:peptidoglycan/LPS O-acetylase OafA/YrhL